MSELKKTDMTIIERLRNNESNGHGCQGCFHSVMDEAADHIEKLENLIKEMMREFYRPRTPTK